MQGVLIPEREKKVSVWDWECGSRKDLVANGGNLGTLMGHEEGSVEECPSVRISR